MDSDKADALTAAEVERARADGVTFVGERNDMPQLYAAADVVLLPSWREGLPRVLLEGSSMGKALLATDSRGSREVVVEGQGGHRVPIRSPSSLADAMVRLAKDPERRRQFGAFNRRRALAEYDLRNVVRRIEGVYDALLEGP
jgi:glycosyltransferase involved in cell wall biosynthesis